MNTADRLAKRRKWLCSASDRPQLRNELTVSGLVNTIDGKTYDLGGNVYIAENCTQKTTEAELEMELEMEAEAEELNGAARTKYELKHGGK